VPSLTSSRLEFSAPLALLCLVFDFVLVFGLLFFVLLSAGAVRSRLNLSVEKFCWFDFICHSFIYTDLCFCSDFGFLNQFQGSIAFLCGSNLIHMSCSSE
jgi:hypothetical protein